MNSIQRITTTVFRLPMEGVLRWGKASALAEVRHVLVEVELSDGSIGVAEAPPRPTIYGETVHSILSIIEHELGPRLLHQPLARVPRGWMRSKITKPPRARLIWRCKMLLRTSAVSP